MGERHKGSIDHTQLFAMCQRNFRQPLHFDGGPLWYADDDGHLWSSISTITNINDGVGTYICDNPVSGIFYDALNNPDDNGAGQHVLSHLRKCLRLHPPTEHLNRAGQVVALHPVNRCTVVWSTVVKLIHLSPSC